MVGVEGRGPNRPAPSDERMPDHSALQERFLSADTTSRLRRVAQNLEIIRDQLDARATAAHLATWLDDTSWMVGHMSTEDEPDVRVELEELRRSLDEWRFELEGIVSVGVARTEARDLIDAWADRLRWIAGLLEATR